MIKTCPGCGSVMQYSDPQKIGYSPKKDAKLCERCFKLKNYNKKETIQLKYNNEDIINLISNKEGAIFFITDFLNISNKVIDTFKKINHHNKYLVINKIDYIPKSIIKEKYVEYIKNTYKIKNDIILVSAIKKLNLVSLSNKIKEYKNSYICGYTNSGKSTIINEICKINNKNSNILSSLMPNTTLDLIKIRIDENIHIFDTPGFINDYEFNEETFPKKFISPITLQTKENDIINVNNNILIKTDQTNNSFTFYMSNLLTIKKVYKIDEENFIDIEIKENSDLILYGYGFINIKNRCVLKINTQNYEIRKSMF